MKLLKSFGKLKKPKLALRRIVGDSMSPTFKAGQIIFVIGRFHNVQPRDVIVFEHQGIEKVKRIFQVDVHKGVFVRGDNSSASTDSRTFGWINFDEITGKVLWPRR